MKDGRHSYCKKCLKKYSTEWGKTNRKKLLSYQSKYFLKYYPEKRKDPRFCIDQSFSSSMRKALNGGKNGRKWETLVGYSLTDLMNRLESQFHLGMTWKNYGTFWHIDHIIPQSWFKYTSANEAAFKECWALNNLQPLNARINAIKGNKYAG